MTHLVASTENEKRYVGMPLLDKDKTYIVDAETIEEVFRDRGNNVRISGFVGAVQQHVIVSITKTRAALAESHPAIKDQLVASNMKFTRCDNNLSNVVLEIDSIAHSNGIIANNSSSYKMYLLALARRENGIILTKDCRGTNISLDTLCNEFNIPCLNLSDVQW